jgi:carbamoyltransferase
MARDLILGLNQYTHSAAVCVLDASGKMLFCGEKERLTRKKHDGGDTAELVEHALEAVGAKLDDIRMVCANNHLFRIDRFHETIDWATALYQHRASYTSEFNLLPGVERLELSHHLAHAWSVLPYAPFDSGIIVVMDGMGSTLHEMQMPGANYHTDLDLEKHPQFHDVARQGEAFGWREGESAFVFEGNELQQLYKRFVAEPTPTLLYNYGFENMNSLGALYSRVSSHIFADWNSCGKVMGMAPWASDWNKSYQHQPILSGSLDDLKVDWQRLHDEPHPHQWSDESNRGGYASLAADMQSDIERVTLDFLQDLRQKTGAKNLIMVGGVALNSTLNGRIHRESGFDEVFIPHYPGDQGLAAGCAAFAYAQLNDGKLPTAQQSLSPYSGCEYGDKDIETGLSDWQDWLEEAELDGVEVADVVAEAINEGKIIAWFDGPSEFGPRALGNRSILADPRRAEMVTKINSAIKKREAYRPFAPTVLSEKVSEWFEDDSPSPYMSLTVQARNDKASEIPAVVHADGSSRIQTLRRKDNPKYYDLIERFEKLSGVPMVLNTSFNIKQEPIVETPSQAMKSFLYSDLDLLVINGRLFQQREFPEMLTSSMVPLAAPNFTAESMSDAEGNNVSVRLMVHGDTYDIEQIELGILEVSNGENTLHDIVDYFKENWDVEQDTLLGHLQGLYSRRLLSIVTPAAVE